jgi:hypothetical protein
MARTYPKRNFRNDIMSVKQFATDYNILHYDTINDERDIINRYMMYYEYTDGDELTFYIVYGNPVEDINDINIDEIYYNRIVSISLDEYEISTNIVDKLYNECVNKNIIIQKI